jgi:hypothetical protein
VIVAIARSPKIARQSTTCHPFGGLVHARAVFLDELQAINALGTRGVQGDVAPQSHLWPRTKPKLGGALPGGAIFFAAPQRTPCHTMVMATYVISATADQTGFVVEVEDGNSGRRPDSGFKTKEEAEAWIVADSRLPGSADQSHQRGFRMLWRL